MKQSILLILILGIFPFYSIIAQDGKGLEVMKSYQESVQVQDLKSNVEYKNVSRKGRVQERKLYQYIQKRPEGKNKYNLLLQFTAPVDIKGTGTLTWQHAAKEDDQWLFLPAVRSARRISPSRKTDRFMGTEITFEDLSNYLSEPLEKYNYAYLGEKERDGQQCHVIEATPTDAEEKANSGYSKRTLWISTQQLINVYTAFYDDDGNLAKEYTAWDVQKVGDTKYYRPFKAKMNNLISGNSTEVFYSNMEIDTGIDGEIFTKNYLESL